jgi:type I restriction enzyme R subunit
MLPALQLLQRLGYTYLTPAEATALRGGRESEVLLLGVLEEVLPEINVIRYRGEVHAFSGGNIAAGIAALRDVLYDGLVRTNEKVYDLLMLGKSLQQPVRGDTKSFTLHYIDWARPEHNVYHVTEEYRVERVGSKETLRPDLVLFVNGIPLCVIECKRAVLHGQEEPVVQAISQHLRNQKDDGIPMLYAYAQLLLSTAPAAGQAKYATTGTPMKFWGAWREEQGKDQDDEAIATLINTPLSDVQKAKVFEGRGPYAREEYERYGEAAREVTDQDRLVYGLCRTERLLDITRRYVVFDAGEKKVPRWQQYFAVRRLLQRVRERGRDGKRLGGVVWHTQGSGKSLTMVMLAKALALEPGLHDQRVILVTDRTDLDDQIHRTFMHCGLEPVQAQTAAHLGRLLEEGKTRVMTTVINKFESLGSVKGLRIDDPNIFVLVDESHRSQYGSFHAKMGKALPAACYIGFTGTPIARREKSTVAKFGDFIQPVYTIRDAVADGAVVPLLYEGRMAPLRVDEEAIDAWFDKITESLTEGQAADLKKKFATSDHVSRAEKRIMAIAWDVSSHFRDNWKDTGFKAQLVTRRKHIALLYKKYLDEFGMVTSAVLISGPDDREGHESTEESEEDRKDKASRQVQLFWKDMMAKHGTEDAYNKAVIGAFKGGGDPEIIIVVDKLLTGFDAPRNTVMYLDKDLKEHTLLQAIARVNRLHEGKDFGYIIDYQGVLANLDGALALYDKLPGFDKEDLEGTLTDLNEVARQLPQKHSDLWDIFNGVGNKYDREDYERLLGDEAIRHRFYQRLSDYLRTLKLALSSTEFQEKQADRIAKYTHDAKFFRELRTSVERRYSDTVNMSEYDARIEKLIDQHVGAGEVEQVTELVNIFERERFEAEVDRLVGEAAKADTIASRTQKTITERMDEDPAFYEKFSKLLRDVIEAWRKQRLTDAEYLAKIKDIEERVRTRTGDEVPERVGQSDAAKAYYGLVKEVIAHHMVDNSRAQEIAADIAVGVDRIISTLAIVNWTEDPDVKNRMKTEIEDLLFAQADEAGFDLSYDEIDSILDRSVSAAISRAKKKAGA